ncbi:MAG TPA: TrkA family potassium uptake protein [Anaerolineaceae bacterium]
MRAIIMGCGRVGEEVCMLLDQAQHEVTVIDPDPAMLDHLGPRFHGTKIRGVGFDRDILLRAGIRDADAFVATSRSDNANIVSARIARNLFQVPKVICRLYDPRRAEIYRRLGLTTISMTTWGAERIHELLTHSDLDPLITFGRGEVSLVSIEVAPSLIGRLAHHITVPGEISVVSITRDGEAILPTLGTEFCAGDLVHLAVLASAMDRLEALLNL